VGKKATVTTNILCKGT